MYEFQSRKSDSIHEFNNRISSYVSMSIGEGAAEFVGTVFYQPSLAEVSDYRIASDAALEIRLSSRLAFRTGINLLYDTRQPEPVPELTWVLRNGFTFHLK
jgi:hypothetical protein